METSLNHFVEYDLDGISSVAAVAESLLANERLAKEAALLLEALIPGLVIEQTTVSVKRVVQESPLKEAFVVALVAACLDQAGIDRKTFSANQSLVDAAAQDGFKRPSQQIALSETTMTVLRERRMVGDVAIKPKAAKPAIR
jgi:hypothetical protein